MKEMIQTITAQCEKLSEDEMKSVADALSSYFEKPIQSLIPELITFNRDELVVINKIVAGVILTKEYVPDIKGAYERLAGTDLPSTISFGRANGE
ncbi:hypothetical protein DFQ01_11141 [Paenibacillus cellulosilyticus]|uniref:Uncharacterized protein n=1 Tax=Paenibacillus cellulosilyticus TaxID=375489 RepID=A0A2V2Z0Y7_9BACL|nr:hypothetical protein [Paenibacillus cellulosilyticus]PWW00896.1 hypothetical protein DFQ01_11141 [Paenibacillus cellulosilyticus]QKS47553.1 hypothetical protein HUB94_24555 [Paenibacillus cellulosilyticus]